MVIRVNAQTRGNRFFSRCRLYRLGDEKNPEIDFIEVTALWDTGAQKSALTYDTASRLGLMPYDRKTVISGVVGASKALDYWATLVLKDETGALFRQSQLFIGINSRPNDSCDLIIGMDIISKGRLVIEPVDGHPLLTFSVEIPDRRRVGLTLQLGEGCP